MADSSSRVLAAREAISVELSALAHTMSQAAPVSMVQEGMGHPRRPPIGERLLATSQLRTVHPARPAGSALSPRHETVNLLGTGTLRLPLDATSVGAAPDAEVQAVLAATGMTARAMELRALKEAADMRQRDTVRGLMQVHLPVEGSATARLARSAERPMTVDGLTIRLADPSTSEYRSRFERTADLDATTRAADKRSVAGFKLTLDRMFVEKALMHGDWPPEGGAPPWPADKAPPLVDGHIRMKK